MAEERTEIGLLWREVQREIQCRMRQAFRGAEIPFIAMLVVRIISGEPGITVSEVARRCGVAKSHVSKTIDQLVQQGYVAKRADPDDQRLIRVDLTEAGRTMQAKVDAIAQGAGAEIMDEIPPAQLADVRGALHILLTAAKSANSKYNQE